MRRKSIVMLLATLVVLGALIAVLILRQSPEEESYRWDIPAEGGSITAAFTDNGSHGFILTLEGSGAIKDFASDKDAPWYSKSGRVTQIVLPEGITAIGDNAFTQCHYVKTVVLPQSVKTIGKNAFSEKTKVCVYAETSTEDALRLYLHSAGKPEQPGNYWHFMDNEAVIWETTKVLFIGNSFIYTYDIDQLFAKLAAAAGYDVQVERITIGSHNLSKFADPSDKGGAMVEAALRASRDYDIIVLQEQSTRPITNPDLFEDGVMKLCSRIRQTQDDCQIYLYATWGYPKQAEIRKQSIPEMEAQLRSAYTIAANKAGVRLSPVGEAFTEVYTKHGDINLYSPDQLHPSYAGAYLSACVHAAKLLGIDPRGSAFDGYPVPQDRDGTTPEFSRETAEILQNAAYSIVFK